MRWPWQRWRRESEAARTRREAEERLKNARRQTPVVRKAAKKTAKMPSDEFADLVNRAFQPRRSA